jgi:hypothetical protein
MLSSMRLDLATLISQVEKNTKNKFLAGIEPVIFACYFPLDLSLNLAPQRMNP